MTDGGLLETAWRSLAPSRRSRRGKRPPALFALLLAALCATASRAEVPTTRPATPQPAVVPFDLMPSGHIAVMAKINGSGPYRFVFDTGAPLLLVGERVAKLSGVLPPKFHRPWFTVLGNLGEHEARSVDLGGGRLDKVGMDVWNHPTVDILAREEGPLEGLIGFPFFAHFRTTIDYRARTITLAPSTFQPVDTRKQLEARMTDDREAVIVPATSLGIRVAKDARDAAPGVIVTNVSTGGAAADAGLLIGDRLLTLDGRWTDGVDDVYTAAANLDPGTRELVATLSRDGRPMTVRIAVRRGI